MQTPQCREISRIIDFKEKETTFEIGSFYENYYVGIQVGVLESVLVFVVRYEFGSVGLYYSTGFVPKAEWPSYLVFCIFLLLSFYLIVIVFTSYKFQVVWNCLIF